MGAGQSAANLVNGTYTQTSTQLGIGFPYVYGQSNNGIMIAAFKNRNWYRSGINNSFPFPSPTTGNPAGGTAYSFSFTPIEAFYIDTKLDDGTPVGGQIIWVGTCTYNCFLFPNVASVDSGAYGRVIVDGPLGASSAFCFNSGSNQFNNTYTDKACDIAIPGQF